MINNYKEVVIMEAV